MIKFKIKVLIEGCEPTKAHPSDAGWDLKAGCDCIIPAGKKAIIPCGIAIELPENYEAQIRPRSGLAVNHTVTSLNAPGTIDAHYRGQIGAIMINHDITDDYYVKKGDRIVQMVVKQVEQSEYEIVENLSETDRGKGGFGSSGK
jgi:dUTP pyrophosphatase